MRTKLAVSVCGLCAVLCGPAWVQADEVVAPVEARVVVDGERPRIQVALLLDTSNSMDGLIRQAKTQLWAMVNELTKYRVAGREPVIEVALYEYGNNALLASDGYIRRVLPMTTDLDAVSEELFALDTDGGSEYCGMVIDRAVRELTWGDGERDMRFVFIAGNEPFTQGELDYALACKAATDRDISVSTVHCGRAGEGKRGEWSLGAQLGNGDALNIEQDRAVVDIPCPQDDRLLELNQKLNGTYIPYGDRGEALQERQQVMDGAAESVSLGTAVTRVATKAGGAYRNAQWDLVDAVEEGEVKVDEVDREQLPEALRELDDEALGEAVAGASEERKALQAEIQRLNAEREAYLKAEMARRDESNKGTLGEALIRTVRTRLVEEGYEAVE